MTMDLLIQFAYPSVSGYAKFTILFTMNLYGEDITYTLGPAIPLTTEDCQLIKKNVVYAQLYGLMLKYAEKYEGENVLKLNIRVYLDCKKIDRSSISEEELYTFTLLSSIISDSFPEIDPIRAREIRKRKSSYPSHITRLKARCTELKPFIVADTETLLINNVHTPYAAGFLMVRPGEKISDLLIETYFSEDNSLIFDSFEDRSTKVLHALVLRIESVVKKENYGKSKKRPMTIYFHNFSRFDGILLLKHLVCHHKSYKLKPLMRNNKLYEIAVYSGTKMLFRFRDSLNLLPSKLNKLAMNLCPDLGQKG